ncbi:hypothetical protein P9112_001711 [Eukaryota sp. TZLM1-RC]
MVFRKAALQHILAQSKPKATSSSTHRLSSHTTSTKATTSTKPTPTPYTTQETQPPPLKKKNISPIDENNRIKRDVASVQAVEKLVQNIIQEPSTSKNSTFHDCVVDKTYYLDNVKITNPNPNNNGKPRKKLPSKLAREAGLLTCPKNICKKVANSMHSLWLDYATSSLKEVKSSQAISSKLITLDWHGASLIVVRSRVPSVIGLRGILIEERANVFLIAKMCDDGDEYKIVKISKKDSIFEIVVGDIRATIFGQNVLCRSAERSCKKFKAMRNTLL